MTVDTLTLAIIIISAIGAGILIALVCLSYNLYTTKAQIAVEMHNIRESLNESTVGPLCVKSIDSKMNRIEEYFIGIGKEWNKIDEVTDDLKMQLNAIEKHLESLTLALNNAVYQNGEWKLKHTQAPIPWEKSEPNSNSIADMLMQHDKTIEKRISDFWKDMDSRMTIISDSLLKSIEQNKACYRLLTEEWRVAPNKESKIEEPNYFSSTVKQAQEVLCDAFRAKFQEEDSK